MGRPGWPTRSLFIQSTIPMDLSTNQGMGWEATEQGSCNRIRIYTRHRPHLMESTQDRDMIKDLHKLLIEILLLKFISLSLIFRVSTNNNNRCSLNTNKTKSMLRISITLINSSVTLSNLILTLIQVPHIQDTINLQQRKKHSKIIRCIFLEMSNKLLPWLPKVMDKTIVGIVKVDTYLTELLGWEHQSCLLQLSSSNFMVGTVTIWWMQRIQGRISWWLVCLRSTSSSLRLQMFIRLAGQAQSSSEKLLIIDSLIFELA